MGPASLSDNWFTGAVDDGSSFGVDLTGIDWPEGTRPAPEANFDFSDVLQNDVYDQLLASTIPTTGALPMTLPSSATITPLQPSPTSTLSHDFSPETTPPFSTGTADATAQRNPRKRSPPVDPETALKRQRNNIAARKYRQKKIDRISELEAELKEVKDDRDDLRVRLARQEAEVAALKSLFRMKAGIDA